MEIYQVDAFTDQPFKGNPAGVCLLSEFKEDSWMQNIAGEMNLAETAFVEEKENGYNLRWFTPEKEVDLCGHATLASAHILWETNRLAKDENARFHTNSGLLIARKNKEGIELDFPEEPEEETKPPENLIQALGVTPKYTGRNRFDYLIEVESEKIVKGLEPNFNLLKKINTRGIIVTSTSSKPKYDFVSRFFAPAVGVNEDPVTGSSHCCLGCYWKNKLNKNIFSACQLSSRGGSLKVRVPGEGRVYIEGKAVTVFKSKVLNY